MRASEGSELLLSGRITRMLSSFSQYLVQVRCRDHLTLCFAKSEREKAFLEAVERLGPLLLLFHPGQAIIFGTGPMRGQTGYYTTPHFIFIENLFRDFCT